MNEQIQLDQTITDIVAELRAKMGVRGKDLATVLAKARPRLPRRIYRQGLTLVSAEPLTAHPKLRLTLDTPALKTAAQEIHTHLDSINLAERRKSWWLGMLGALAFNLILMVVLLIIFLRWRGVL